MKLLHIGFPRLSVLLEYLRSPVQKLLLLFCDLDGMDMEPLRQFNKGLFSFDRFQCHPRLEYCFVIPSRSFCHDRYSPFCRESLL